MHPACIIQYIRAMGDEREMTTAELAASLPPLEQLVPRMQQLEQVRLNGRDWR